MIKFGDPERAGDFFNRIMEGPRICLSQDEGGVRLSLIMDIALLYSKSEKNWLYVLP